MQIWPKKTKAEMRAYSRAWKQMYPERALLVAAKTRATKRELPFDLEESDIVIPEICPYLKKPLKANTRYAPSLDKIDPAKGYVKGNIEVISRKANVMKNDASVEELLEFAYEILERH